MLPEYLIEDVIEFYLYLVRYVSILLCLCRVIVLFELTWYCRSVGLIRNSQGQLETSGKNELVVFALTLLSSPWYIKNPFLKAKLVQVRFCFPLRIPRSCR